MNNALIPAAVLVEIDGEPRIRDVVLAERLEFDRPRVIRELISRNKFELEAYGGLPCRTANPGKQGGRPSQSYYLNEGQALVICALSRTQRAAEVRKLLIDVFMAWRHGKTVDVKQHYRRPPASIVSDISFEMVSHDGKTALVEIIMPFGKALALMKSVYALN